MNGNPSKLKVVAEMLLILVLVIIVFTPLMLEQVITQKLNSGKAITTGRIKVLPLTRSISITDLKVHQVILGNGYMATGTVPELGISGIPVWSLLQNHELSFGKVVFHSPLFHITWDSLNAGPVSENPEGKLKLEKIKSLKIVDGSFSMVDSSGGIVSLKEIDLGISPVFLNGEAILSSAEKFNLKTGHLNYLSSDKIHMVSIDRVRASSRSMDIILDSVKVIPSYSEAEFRKHIPYQTERFQLDCPVMTVSLHKKKWMNDNHYHLSKLTVESLHMKVFRDKRIPRDPEKRYKYLQYYLSRSRLKMNIDTLLVNNSHITYRERAETSNETGEVEFSNANIVASNLILGVAGRDELKIELKTSFMKTSTLNGTIKIPYKENYFLCHGKLSNLPVVETNRMSEPVAGFVFNNGVIHAMTFNFTAYESHAEGDLQMQYKELDFTFKNKPAGDSTNFMSKVKTIAASLFMKKEARKGNESVTSVGQICNPRRTDRFIFNYMWKSILSGVKSALAGTIGEELTSNAKSPC